MSLNVRDFDYWIRHDFKALNTELEELYFAQSDRANVESIGDSIKQQILTEGGKYVGALLREGNTDQGFDRGFDLLGNVGLYMAACARHGAMDQSDDATPSPQEEEASALAMQLGASLGVSPRFATSHLTTHNRSVDGSYKSFTTLRDEYIFTEYNARGILAYKRAADALLRILALGISHPVAYDLLIAARDALQDVARFNMELFEQLDTQRFFYCVRPYFKPHRVGLHVYRGANAGDFAGINVIDLLLGLCRPDQAYYSQLLVDKFLYMMPEDQQLLRDCMRRRSLMDEFLEHRPEAGTDDWCHRNLRVFVEICDAHGETAAQHHDQLVEKYIVGPAQELDEQYAANVTASGPPLSVLLRALEKLRDLRMANPRLDTATRHDDLQDLREMLSD